MKHSYTTNTDYSPTGPKRLAMRPFGATTDWNFRPCTRLWPLYMTLWCSPGRQTGLTVPSSNPQQLASAAPFWLIARANNSSWAGLCLEGDGHGY